MNWSWQLRLDGAFTDAEVMLAAREFLAALSAAEIARLPPACRPPELTEAEDLRDYAYLLASHHCDDEAGSARLTQRMADFFSSATVRLSEIMRIPPGRNDGFESV